MAYDGSRRIDSKQYKKVRSNMQRFDYLTQTPAVIVEPAYGDLNFKYNLLIGADTSAVPGNVSNTEYLQASEGLSSGFSKKSQVYPDNGKAELISCKANVDMIIPEGDTVVIHNDENMSINVNDTSVFNDSNIVVIQNDENSEANEVYGNIDVANYANARENYDMTNSDHNYYGNAKHIALLSSNGEPNGVQNNMESESGNINITDTPNENYEQNYGQVSVETEHIYNEDHQYDNELLVIDEPNHTVTVRDRDSDSIHVEEVNNELRSSSNVTVVDVHGTDFDQQSGDDLYSEYENDRNYRRQNHEYHHNHNQDTQSDDDLEGEHETHRSRENLHPRRNYHDGLRLYSRYERSARAQSDVEYPGIYGHINCQCKKCIQCGKPIIRLQSDMIRASWRLNQKLKELKKYENTANILQRALELPYDENRDKLVVKILNILNTRMRTLEKARLYGKRKATMQKYCTDCEFYYDDYYYRRSRYRN